MFVILISVVIPVYNKELYLEKCISSIVNQSYNNIEIIVVNDGSNDDSEKIINDWYEKDKRIKYFKQSNKGVAVARNKGILESSGEYLYFIDADDFVENKAIEVLVKSTEKEESDIIVGNHYLVNKNKNIKSSTFAQTQITIDKQLSTQTKADMFFYRGRPLASACNKLYKLSFIQENKIQFIKDVFAEDRLFNIMCYINKPDIYFVEEYTYYYNIIESSRSRSISDSFFHEYTNLLYVVQNYIRNESNFNQYQDLMELLVIYDSYKIIYKYFESNNTVQSVYKALKQIKSDKLMDTVLKRVPKNNLLKKITISKRHSLRYSLLIYLYNFFPLQLNVIIYYIYLKFYNSLNRIK